LAGGNFNQRTEKKEKGGLKGKEGGSRGAKEAGYLQLEASTCKGKGKGVITKGRKRYMLIMPIGRFGGETVEL